MGPSGSHRSAPGSRRPSPDARPVRRRLSGGSARRRRGMAAQQDRRTVILRDPRATHTSPDLADAVAQVVRLCFGLLSIAQAVMLRNAEDSTLTVPERRPLMPAGDVADLVLGTAWGAARLSGRLATSGSRVVVPLIG